MDKVIAVVVTYNRQALLAQCISALRKQTRKVDNILVINNGSTDQTEAWLNNQPDIDLITQENLGGAGGFYTGIKTAFERSYTWLWLMDDDGLPKEDALEKLLENTDEKLCLRNCAVINKEDKKSFVWKTGNYATIDEVKEPVIKNFAHPFNGTLLHKDIVKKVGLPKKELFIWGDETEYYERIITKYKIPFYTKADSIHYHPAGNYSYKNDWDYSSNWKMYFYIRNRFAILKTKFSDKPLLAYIAYICFLIVFFGMIMIFQKTDKLKKARFMIWPVKDALTDNYTATPSVVLQNISSHSCIGPIPVLQIFKKLSFRSISTVRELKKA